MNLVEKLDALDKWAGGLDEDDADRVWEVVYHTRELIRRAERAERDIRELTRALVHRSFA